MTRFRLIALSLLAALALVAAACGGDEANVPADAIAVVDGHEIPKSEFDALMRQAQRSYKQQKRPFPKAGTPEYRTLKNNAVQYLVERQQFRLAAEEMNVEITAEEVDKKLAELKKQYYGGSEKKYRAALKEQGMSEEQVRETVRDQLVQQEVYEKVTADVKVEEGEIEKYYRTNKKQFGTPESREVRHILVPRKKLAEQLRQRIVAGESFATLAKRHSKDPSSAAQGGKLTVSRGAFVAPFEKEAFRLSTGEVSQPVKTQYGFHLIEPLSKVRPASTRPLSQVKDQIRQQLLQEKRNEAVTDWVEETKKEYREKTHYQVGFAPAANDATTTR